MRRSMTRNTLYMIEQEIYSMQKESPALALLLAKSIDQFFTRAKHELSVMHGRFNQLKEKYIQKDEQGTYLKTGEGENQKWKFITSLPDLEKARIMDVSQVEQKFNEEAQAFFKQTIQIEW